MTARRAAPARSKRLTLAGLAAGSVLALATACGSGSAASPPDSTATSASPSSPAEPTPSDSPSTSARPSPTPYPTTTTAHSKPWTDKNADFGFVSKAKVVTGGVQFSFDRATWLLADQVAAWNKANPSHQVPTEADGTVPNDYAIGNVSTRLRTFVVVTGAKIFGSIILSDQPEPKRITAAQFVSRVNGSFEPVTCWLFHQYGGLTGNVVQLEEQYRP